MKQLVLALAVAVAAGPDSGAAQSLDGYASVLVDTLPNIRSGAAAAQGVVELRSRVFADYRRDLGSRVRFALAGFAEGLVADRGGEALTRTAIVRPQELTIDARWQHVDVRVGFSRVVWGRLDELLPTDVVNPQDLTRFFLEGRSEGRMPVGMLRTRWLPSDAFSVEAIYVPFFRAGRFDQLDEDSAPFNIRPARPARPALPALSERQRVEGSERQRVEGPPLPTTRSEPPHSIGNAQGGMRASVTSGRVDWSLSAYRGFEPLPVYDGVGERFPRFTMVGGDFETIRGIWGIRGEIAAFVDRTLQAANALVAVKARSLEAGLGLDRKAGAYRVSGNVIFTKRLPLAVRLGDAGVDRTDLTLVTAVDRSFASETRSIRTFAVYNPGEHSAFARVIGTISVRDDVSLEASAGVFAGRGSDVLARFADRDFLYARLKVFFLIIPLHAENPGAMTGSGNWTYLLDGPNPLLIDAGIGVAAHLDAIAAHVSNGPRHVVVTHGHEDHASGAAAIAARWPQTRFSKMPWPERDRQYGVDWNALVDGQAIDAGDGVLHVVHTPGHAPDHICLWRASTRELFCGDLVVLGSTVVIPASSGGNLTDYLRSLTHVSELAPSRLLPAHGPPIDDPAAVIRRYRDHRQQRETQVLMALRDGRQTIDSITERIYVGLPSALTAMARESVLAHLVKLEHEGLAQRVGSAWERSDAGG